MWIADSPGPLPPLSGAIGEHSGERIAREEGASGLELNRTDTGVRTVNDTGALEGSFMRLLDSAVRGYVSLLTTAGAGVH